MKVTEIRLNLMESDRVVKAVGSILLDDVFAVRGIRVMEDKNENLLMAFPSRQNQNGELEDVAFPISKELYSEISESVIAEYKRLCEQRDNFVEESGKGKE